MKKSLRIQIEEWVENNKSVMTDVMLGKREKTEFKPQTSRMNEARVTDRNTYVCPKCNRAWEYLLANSGTGYNKGITLYSKNVSKYKKQRKICNTCIG